MREEFSFTTHLVTMLTAAVLTGRRVLLGPVIGTAIILAQQNLMSVGGDRDKVMLSERGPHRGSGASERQPDLDTPPAASRRSR